MRYRNDGTLEFLGRIDRQVKLRGFRIELGEVESVLENHLGVRQAVVMLREDSPDDQRLAAYVVTGDGSGLKIDELKRFLRGKLPDYMIPSGFVFLDAFPLTSIGKIDRMSLPAIVEDSENLIEGYVAPRNAVEQILAMIWKDVLKLQRVGIGDNFFEAGGHSLLATQVVSRMRSILRVDIPVRKLFEAPTVEQLSRIILAGERSGSVERIARVLVEIEAMSPEAAGAILEEKKRADV